MAARRNSCLLVNLCACLEGKDIAGLGPLSMALRNFQGGSDFSLRPTPSCWARAGRWMPGQEPNWDCADKARGLALQQWLPCPWDAAVPLVMAIFE